MCGIFGAIGRGFNKDIIRGLAIANRQRGIDATGFVGSDGKIVKEAEDPMDFLAKRQFSEYCETWDDMWFILGHTRHGTRGLNKDENAHPFQYGKWIGIHNGVIQAPFSYNVDSMYLWDQLNKKDGNYQEAWEEISGWWGLAWTDLEHVWLQTNNNDLSLCLHNGIIYFSSDSKHLFATLGARKVSYMKKEGQTVKIKEDGTYSCLPPVKFKPKKNYVENYHGANHYQQSGTYSHGNYSTNLNKCGKAFDGENPWWENCEEEFDFDKWQKENLKQEKEENLEEIFDTAEYDNFKTKEASVKLKNDDNLATSYETNDVGS